MMLELACFTVLFEVGVSLYVIMNWALRELEALEDYLLLKKVNTSNRCSQACQTPISPKCLIALLHKPNPG
jgi:hypothetical protein